MKINIEVSAAELSDFDISPEQLEKAIRTKLQGTLEFEDAVSHNTISGYLGAFSVDVRVSE